MPKKTPKKASPKPKISSKKAVQSPFLKFMHSKVFWAAFLIGVGLATIYAYLKVNQSPLAIFPTVPGPISQSDGPGGSTLVTANFSPANCIWGGYTPKSNWGKDIAECKNKMGRYSVAKASFPSRQNGMLRFTIDGINNDGRQIWVYVNGKKTVITGNEANVRQNEIVNLDGKKQITVLLPFKSNNSGQVTVKAQSPSTKNNNLPGKYLGDSVLLGPVVFEYGPAKVTTCSGSRLFGLDQFNKAKTDGKSPFFAVNTLDLIMPVGTTTANVQFGEIGRADYFKVGYKQGSSNWIWDRSSFNPTQNNPYSVDFSRVYSANGSREYAIFAFNSAEKCSYGVPVILTTSTSLPQGREPTNPNGGGNRINPGSLNY